MCNEKIYFFTLKHYHSNLQLNYCHAIVRPYFFTYWDITQSL